VLVSKNVLERAFTQPQSFACDAQAVINISLESMLLAPLKDELICKKKAKGYDVPYALS